MDKLIGLVLSGSNNVFDVETTDDEGNFHIFQCTLKSKRLKTDERFYNPLAPGDKVEIECDCEDENKGQIINLLERKNAFVRWNVKGRAPQLLASNLDYVLLVTTPDDPPFRPRFIDRELAQAEAQNLTPVIIVNKYDVPASQESDFQNRISIWQDLGYKVIKISAKTGEGLPELAEFVQNKLCALVGQSGIGKSSIVNVLDNSCVLKTGSLSQKYGRGTHTTTKGTLMHIHLNESLVGGIQNAYADIIDTPGVRRFVLNNIKANELAFYFRELKPLIGKCDFGMSCTHLTEPGCKILEGVCNGSISEERYESWKKICDEIKTGNWAD